MGKDFDEKEGFKTTAGLLAGQTRQAITQMTAHDDREFDTRHHLAYSSYKTFRSHGDWSDEKDTARQATLHLQDDKILQTRLRAQKFYTPAT